MDASSVEGVIDYWNLRATDERRSPTKRHSLPKGVGT